ncbi:ester cyclase [Streptomyces sp. NPDC049577]|uniref:ester cyclase n=1 Tax=Streptomyces sp. NPDC049577 TaxID=3155153 RepID=UPI00342D97F1
MTFVQLIDCRTSRYDDMNRLMDEWVAATEGKRTATHSLVGRDRSDGDHFIELIEFPSYEDAMKNSNLPETNRIFEEIVALCDGMPNFTDLDVVRDEQLNKATARRFYDEVAVGGDLGLIDELFAEDYREHDLGAWEEPADDREAFRETVAGWRNAFEFRFDLHSLVAEGDEVVVRWTWRGTHRGDFRGLAPTGRQAAMDGFTTFRLEDGRIREGWWTYDMLGLLRQLGAVEAQAEV